MPLTREHVHGLPHSPGVYIYLDAAGKELYVGKAKDLRKRVAQYITNAKKDRKIHKLVTEIAEIKFIEASDEIDALIMEARLIRELQPDFNILLKDDDPYPYLEFTLGDEYPKVNITRQPNNRKSRYIGPFTDVTALRTALRAVQPIFKFCSCSRVLSSTAPRQRGARPCLNYHIGLCDAPCSGRITPEEYRKKIKAMILFFSGRKDRLVAQMHNEMIAAASELRFEEAIALREQIKAMEKLAKPSAYQRNAVTFTNYRPESSLALLMTALDLPREPARIEGYDISNLGEESAVGSLVCFLDAMPYKPGYRRFRIKTVEGQNDFAMIGEVLRRRARHIVEGEDPPDLILIDGGQGQVNEANAAIKDAGLDIVVVGLAKQHEHIIFADGRTPLALPKSSAALRLLQQVRDEAHRFAQDYHHLLRAKKVIPGYKRPGRKRRKAQGEGTGPRAEA
ncbi:MAG: excinuclease ABC subunit UvrC [Candidatus Brocadiia bacterium]